jgi:hypothetical protein
MEEGGAAEPVEGAVKQTGGSVRYQPGSDLRIDTAAGALVARAGSDVRVTVYPDGDPRRSEVLRRHGLDPRGGPLAVVQCLDGAVTGGVVAAGGTERVLRPAEPRRARERERAPEAESAPPRSDAPRPAIVRKPQAPAPAPEPGPRARTGARKIQGSVTGLTDAERLEVGVYPLAPRVGQPLPPLRRERRTRPGEGGAWVLETPEDWPRRVAVYLVQQGRVTDVRQGDPGGSVDFRPRTRARVRSFEGTVVDRETFLPLKAAITVADPETSSLLWEPLTCRADGSFAAMIPSFEWRIEARAPGFGAALLEAEMGGAMRTSDLQLQLLPEGRIEGRVVDQRGRPVRATMDLRKPAGSRAAWDSAELPATDDQGRFQVRGLAEGEYQLVARPVEPAQPPTVVPVRVGRRRTTGTLVRVESAPMRFLMLESHLGGEESTWWEGRIELLDERKVLVAEDTLTLREQSWRRALPAGQYRVRIDGIGTEPVDQVVDFRTAVHANISLRPR